MRGLCPVSRMFGRVVELLRTGIGDAGYQDSRGRYERPRAPTVAIPSTDQFWLVGVPVASSDQTNVAFATSLFPVNSS